MYMADAQSLPFKCPNCEALYQIVRVEVALVNDRKITCLDCGGTLTGGRDGQFILKYFRSRLSGHGYRRRYRVT